MVQTQTHTSVIIWKQNARRTSICLRYDPDLARWKLVRTENPKAMPNRIDVRFHVLAVQVTPITARMSPHQISRIHTVDLTESQRRSGDDHLPKLK